MSKINELLAAEGEAAENAPTPADGHRRNANRSVMFSVRFNPEELEELQRYAERRGLPARSRAAGSCSACVKKPDRTTA
jgi:hypothetical protein